MPELPEVETTKNGIVHNLKSKTVKQVIIRQPKLRWPVPEHLPDTLAQQTIQTIQRRGKYILLTFPNGHLISHLGMSGSFRVLPTQTPIKKHDHIDIIFQDDLCLRYHDPRRFGCLLWTDQAVEQHKLISVLGVEPLEQDLTGEYLYKKSRPKRVAIKNFIMDSHIVVGVGNIYANEALFLANIHPSTPAQKVGLAQYEKLVAHIKQVLATAIQQGGTTLRDFTNADGQAGYFQQTLHVYGKAGEQCSCGRATIEKIVIGQRASYFCPACQPI
ncbi:bifunctional DNA-formamidopyrimidine glycosylase/DNA-(apurinic or apyrimidinic site) lyase [Candidatus Albibeggiatoa sp. nov. NOAA]|uniref:bifunctional DNA-formamidopyrimidine glycosylase/DNA-(apurinic or apyrimidinic site) lyase n=1 Tax=Candidatus Albibeggiatoa sp. nov. NOAA TaxID=3162724 RepID=UPI0032FDDAA0|nr:bifunctional DNA-formamidopyrimidine glycosylase/DNA-(apurinic or apyrimidinic site) lyase [Thiotrichaceae bacterium]